MIKDYESNIEILEFMNMEVEHLGVMAKSRI